MDLKEINKIYDFSNRTFVITGGTGVLGGEIACALVGLKANVAIMDRNPQLEEKVLKRIETYPGKAVVIFGDVLDKSLIQRSAENIIREFGQIDGLINAAGGNHPEATTSSNHSFFDLPIEALRKTMDLNLLGTIIPSQVFGKYMAERGEELY